MKKLDNFLSIIAIVISIILVPINSYLTYYFSMKSFKKQENDKKTFVLVSSVDRLVSSTDQFLSLTKTINLERMKKSTIKLSEMEFFSNNDSIVYEEVLNLNILPQIISDFDKLIDNGFIQILENNSSIKDKFISIYWFIKSSQKSDIEKLKSFHIIMKNENLLNDLKNYNSKFFEDYFN